MTLFASLYDLTTILIYPVFLLLTLLLVTLFLKKHKKIKSTLIVTIVLLYVMSTGILIQPIFKTLNKYPPVTAAQIKEHHALIVLGAGLNKSNDTVVPSMIAYSRLLEAFKIYHSAKQLEIPYTVIISGGDPQHLGQSEAEVYGKVLQQMGVAKDHLILETKSFNTYQNAKFTKKILADLPFKKYLLITSNLHMERSLLYFKHFDIPVTPAVASQTLPLSSWLPSAYNLALLEMAIHEQVGIGRIYLYDWLGLN